MKRIVLPLVLVLGTTLACTSAFAAPKSCADLKAEIAAKLKAKGVEHYSLDIVPAHEVQGKKIVGSCEGGSKKIAYARGNMVLADAGASASSETAAAAASADASSKSSSAEASTDASKPTGDVSEEATSKAAPANNAAAPSQN